MGYRTDALNQKGAPPDKEKKTRGKQINRPKRRITQENWALTF
jgi:hypothetical protein